MGSCKTGLGMPLAIALAGSIIATGAMVAPAAQASTRAMAPVATVTGTAPGATATQPVASATQPAATVTATKPAATAPRVAPTATIKPTTRATATATVVIKATLAVTPTVTNRGGVVTVSGAGFMAAETVAILINGSTTSTLAKADARGLFPATGVTIPYSFKLGTYTISAAGVTSKRSVSATITVQALTPSISVSPATVQPNGVVTVTGRGFGRQEQVTLSLNGAALLTTPAPITTTNGGFTATFKAPNSLLQGTNTISAIGNESRVSAIANLTGQLSLATQFYFAGGLNTAGARSFVNLLNPNGQPARVVLNFYFAGGATFGHIAVVEPHAQLTVAVAPIVHDTGSFGLTVTADRQVTAQLNITRPGKDGDALLGNTGTGTRWYLAEGYTGLTFHETVAVFNPGTVMAQVRLQILPLGGGAGKTVPVTVRGRTNVVVDINSQLKGKSISIVATSDQPVVVERTLTFSNNGYGMTTRAGTNVAASSWLFAEGTTVNRFETFLTILNPNSTPAVVTASFFGRNGGPLGSRTLVVAGQSRGNIKLNDVLSASGIASVVTSNQAIVVERPEYFGSPNDARIAGSVVFGRNGAGVRWSFPGGNTQGNNSEFLLLYNPSAIPVTVNATVYGTGGKTAAKSFVVQPTQRLNIDVSAAFPGVTGIHGAIVQTPNAAQGFIAEQTVFARDHSTLRSTEGLAQ